MDQNINPVAPPVIQPALPPKPKRLRKVLLTLFLVVIVVLGILFYLASQNCARCFSADAKRNTALNIIKTALEVYDKDHENYPMSLDQLIPQYVDPKIISDAAVKPSLTYTKSQDSHAYELCVKYESKYRQATTPDGRYCIHVAKSPVGEAENPLGYKHLGGGYYSDGEKIHLILSEGESGSHTILTDVNLETFEVLSTKAYAKDDKHVYYFGNLIEGANPQTFKLVGCAYSKDDVRVYQWEKVLEGADPATFALLDTKFLDEFGCTYTKDKNYVYKHGKILPGENPKTFKIPQ